MRLRRIGARGNRQGMRGVAIAIALTAAATASADMPARLTVAGQGECPTAAALARALERLHPTLRAEVGDGAGVEVVDGGASYEVRAAGSVRRLDDAGRRCSERATAAALAATLLIDPPTAPLEDADSPPGTPDGADGPLAPRETPGPASARPVTTPAAAVAPSRGQPARVEPANVEPANVVKRPVAPAPRLVSRIELELVGVFDGAPAIGSAASEVTGGAALRLTVGGRHFAGTFGISGLAPATATSASVDVTVSRIPFDTGLRLIAGDGRYQIGADVGLVATLLQLSAPALDQSTTSTRLDVAVRLAPFLRVGLTKRLALVAGAQMAVSFAPFDLVVGTTRIATTPRLWLGGGLGLVAGL